MQGIIIVRNTHRITAERIYKAGDTYYVAKRARVVHLKRQHAPVTVKNGLFRVQEGQRSRLWDFSERRRD